MTPPPGAVRKEGTSWVATFQTPNREAHYVGTFTSQTEALAAYYERAAYYEKLRNVVTSSSPSCTPKSSSSSMRKLRILMRRHAVSGGQLFHYMDSKRCGRITFEMFKYVGFERVSLLSHDTQTRQQQQQVRSRNGRCSSEPK